MLVALSPEIGRGLLAEMGASVAEGVDVVGYSIGSTDGASIVMKVVLGAVGETGNFEGELTRGSNSPSTKIVDESM